MSIYFFSEGGKEDYKQISKRKERRKERTMEQEKLICIMKEDDSQLKELQSQGYHIQQISASGIYCWVLLIKPKPKNQVSCY